MVCALLTVGRIKKKQKKVSIRVAKAVPSLAPLWFVIAGVVTVSEDTIEIGFQEGLTLTRTLVPRPHLDVSCLRLLNLKMQHFLDDHWRLQTKGTMLERFVVGFPMATNVRSNRLSDKNRHLNVMSALRSRTTSVEQSSGRMDILC